MNQTTSQKPQSDTLANSEILGDCRVAFIQAGWHRDIVDQGQRAFVETFARLGGHADNVDIFHVPGSYEIPLQAKSLSQSGVYDAIVCAGLVVNGGIYAHEFVANAVISGLMTVQLDSDVPVLTMVLTPLNFHETEDHLTFFSEHFLKKGAEAAEACVATVLNRADLKKLAA